MKKVIITGAGGFIGGNLAKKLLSEGTIVYGIDINTERMEYLKEYGRFISVKAEFQEYLSLPEKLGEKGFDVFYHLAWMGYGKDTNEFDVQIQNVIATRNAVVAAGEACSKKFVMACSSHEYQQNCTGNVEGNRVGPCSIYGASKTASKTYAKVVAHSYDMDFCGAIFTNVFGVGDRSKRTANFFIHELMLEHNLNLIKGDRLYDWTYIDDVVGGLAAIGEDGKDGKEYYVGNAQLRPFKKIIEEVRDILAPKAKLNFGVYPDTSYIDYSGINIYELYEDTGYISQCNFKDSVLKTAEWVKTLDF